uniref:Pentacotripeptide-repeat region of PRORP domain-containing protein n=1 Tax=Leptocylindrus danicus TaxID=163516 RepID=A0A7S2KNY5_9STRA
MVLRQEKREALPKSSSNTLAVQPDRVMFNIAIDAWGKSTSKEDLNIAPLRAEELLQKMEQFQSERLKPDTVTYNTVMEVWCRSLTKRKSGGSRTKENRIAAQRVMSILKRMEQMYEEGEERVKPDTRTYTTAMDVLAKSSAPGSARQAEQILIQMKRAHASGNEDARPNAFSYSALIYAWAKSNEHCAAERAESILRETERLSLTDNTLRPFTQTYDAVIDAWARSPHPRAHERAKSVFIEMLQRYRAGDERVEPTVRSFSKVFLAFARASTHDKTSPYKAEEFLQLMEDLNRRGIVHVQPNSIIFTTLIDTWAKSASHNPKQAPERAEYLLTRMQQSYANGETHLKPDNVAFCSVVDAWVKSGRTDAALRIVSLISQMEKLYKFRRGDVDDEDLKPNKMPYNSLIQVLVNSSEVDCTVRAKHADQVLHRMFSLYLNGDYEMKPDQHVCMSVIDLWSKTLLPESQEKIDRIKILMKDI